MRGHEGAAHAPHGWGREATPRSGGKRAKRANSAAARPSHGWDREATPRSGGERA